MVFLLVGVPVRVAVLVELAVGVFVDVVVCVKVDVYVFLTLPEPENLHIILKLQHINNMAIDSPKIKFLSFFCSALAIK